MNYQTNPGYSEEQDFENSPEVLVDMTGVDEDEFEKELLQALSEDEESKDKEPEDAGTESDCEEEIERMLLDDNYVPEWVDNNTAVRAACAEASGDDSSASASPEPSLPTPSTPSAILKAPKQAPKPKKRKKQTPTSPSSRVEKARSRESAKSRNQSLKEKLNRAMRQNPERLEEEQRRLLSMSMSPPPVSPSSPKE